MLADRTQTEAVERLRAYPLLEALFTRRSRRISRGASFRSGVLTFSSTHDPQPVSPLEEAVLIAATSRTGVTFADSPFLDEEGGPLLPTPLMSASGGASASPDQAFPTRFFMWNDSGTYFIRHPEESAPPVNAFELAAEELLAYVEGLKVKVSDQRPDFPRRFPAYLGRNRYSSNVPGSTVFVPLVEATEQYINGLLLVLSHPDGQRPAVLDDFNFYRPAGCSRWIRSAFLNRELKMPLGLYAKGRVDYEALLLTQNLALVAAAIGLGGWLHSTFPPIMLLGGTEYGEGLGFRLEPTVVPGRKRAIRRAVRLRRMLRPFPAGQPNPVGLDGVLESYCPPYYANMDAAIDAVLAKKVGPAGLYEDPQFFARTLRPELVQDFIEQTPRYDEESVACLRAICNYIYDRYGRFPAHCNAIEAPGICFQVHHIDSDYYEKFFQPRYSRAEREHQRVWHGED
jgi:hypothetical protein